jgi:ABC-type transport system involved in multi-copper enzyme maturation permease subunit
MTPIRHSENVFMGRQDYISVLLRLTGAELYKLRRRSMSKVFSIVAICAILLGLAISSIQAFVAISMPVTSYLAKPCPSSARGSLETCLDHAPSQADLQDAAAVKQTRVYVSSSLLRLPGSFLTSSQIIQALGLVLLIILASTIAGGEYGMGTIRLLYTRGPTRTQVLLAKALCLLTCAAVGTIILSFLGVLTGALLNFSLGQPADLGFLTGEHLLHGAAYLGIVVLGLLIYALIALFISTLGKTIAAGLAGALLWSILESVLGGVFVFLSNATTGVVSDILKAVPDYFVGNNINVLLSDQEHFLQSRITTEAGDPLHAILVLLGYTVVLVAGACLISARRDVVN